MTRWARLCATCGPTWTLPARDEMVATMVRYRAAVLPDEGSQGEPHRLGLAVRGPDPVEVPVMMKHNEPLYDRD